MVITITVTLAVFLSSLKPAIAEYSAADQLPDAACDVFYASSQLAELPERLRYFYLVTARAMVFEDSRLSSILKASAITAITLE